jgi:hypothetical protein
VTDNSEPSRRKLHPTKPGDEGTRGTLGAEGVQGSTHDEIVKKYFETLIASPDAYRSHAQNAYAIAAAIATTIVTAGVLSDVSEMDDDTFWFGLGAVGSWLLAAALFLRAVETHPRGLLKPEEAQTPEQFVKNISAERRRLRTKIAGWLGRARVVTYVAMALTLVAVALGLDDARHESPPQPTAARFLLGPRAQEQVAALGCKEVQDTHHNSHASLGKAVIKGKADLAKLDTAWIKVTIDEGQCDEANGDLWIATSRLVAVRPQK